MKKILYSREEIEQIVVMHRLYRYNRGRPCGANAVRLLTLQPLPSVSSILRILSQNGLTHARTGVYP